jgi:enoyl-CoA hydratase
MTEPVLYDERDDIAIITLNRPEKKNTLTDAVVQGIADGIDAATRSRDVVAIVVRGAGGTLTAGYDLTAGAGHPGDDHDDRGDDHPHDDEQDAGEPGDAPPGWSTPYGARGPTPRAGAWDPVRDYQFMGNNVRRFMKLWECPKPVLGEITGWAVGGATDLVLCADLLYMASDAHIGYAPSRIFGTPTTMMWVYRLGLEHAKQFLLTGRAIDAPTAHRIGLVSRVCPPEEISSIVEAEARRFRHIPANQLALNKLLVNQAFENMGLRTSQMLGTFFDGMTRHTEEAYRWVESFEDRGFREVIRERDAPWQDYGERPR